MSFQMFVKCLLFLRIQEFKVALSEESINLKTLRELCFNGNSNLWRRQDASVLLLCVWLNPRLCLSGVPFEGGIRALCWKVSWKCILFHFIKSPTLLFCSIFLSLYRHELLKPRPHTCKPLANILCAHIWESVWVSNHWTWIITQVLFSFFIVICFVVCVFCSLSRCSHASSSALLF